MTFTEITVGMLSHAGSPWLSEHCSPQVVLFTRLVPRLAKALRREDGILSWAEPGVEGARASSGYRFVLHSVNLACPWLVLDPTDCDHLGHVLVLHWITKLTN